MNIEQTIQRESLMWQYRYWERTLELLKLRLKLYEVAGENASTIERQIALATEMRNKTSKKLKEACTNDEEEQI